MCRMNRNAESRRTHFALRIPQSAIPLLLSALLTIPAAAQSDAQAFLGAAISAPARIDDEAAQQFFGARTAAEFLTAWRLRAGDRGALVSGVLPGLPADQFGIIPGDLIVAVNGAEVASPENLQRLIGAMRPGAEVSLTLLRAGREKNIAVRLEPRPAQYPPVTLPKPESEIPPVPPPPVWTPALVTPAEAAKALGEDFGPEPAAAGPDYDAAVKLYRESPVARAEGLLLAGPLTLGAGDAAVARAGDELLKLDGKPIATPMGFAFEIRKHEGIGDFPLMLDLRASEGAEGPARTLGIGNSRDADRAAAVLFFTDEDRVLLWLLDFFPPDSAKNAEEQRGLSPQAGDSARFAFPAVVLTAPVTLRYDGGDSAHPQPLQGQEVRCAPGDILVRTQWMQPAPDRLEDSLLFIHDGRRAWLEGANWNPLVAHRSEWCEPVRLQARQLLECVVAARALRLAKLAEEAEGLLLAAYPGSKEAAALSAHDRPIQLAAWHARLRESAAVGDIRPAVEAARALLGMDPQGRYGQEAMRFMDCVQAAAAARIARAGKLLDAGDAAGAREETATVASAFPEDARLASLLGRCDDVTTLQDGRRALDRGQLRRARLMAEAVIARDSGGVEAKPAQQLLDDVRRSAKSQTDRANRLLDAGDVASAREELAPVLQAFPDDPAALAAWNRSRPAAK